MNFLPKTLVKLCTSFQKCNYLKSDPDKNDCQEFVKENFSGIMPRLRQREALDGICGQDQDENGEGGNGNGVTRNGGKGNGGNGTGRKRNGGNGTGGKGNGGNGNG